MPLSAYGPRLCQIQNSPRQMTWLLRRHHSPFQLVVMEITGTALLPSLQRKQGEVSEASYDFVHEQTLNPQFFKLLVIIVILKKENCRDET